MEGVKVNSQGNDDYFFRGNAGGDKIGFGFLAGGMNYLDIREGGFYGRKEVFIRGSNMKPSENVLVGWMKRRHSSFFRDKSVDGEEMNNFVF